MDLFSLHCFIAIAETKSFTKAAQRVGRTQSAITQQISNLEKFLGGKLFLRNKTIELTHQGEMLLPYALKIYGLNQEVIEKFKHPELDGEIRFGVPEDFATFLLSDVLVNFSRSHPRIFLNVDCDLTLHLYEKFNKGKLDLVLLKMVSRSEFPQGLDLWEEPLVWVGNPYINVEESAPLSLVLSPDPCVYRIAALRALDQAQIGFRIVYTSPSYAGILAAVQANLGITVLPKTMIPDFLKDFSNSKMPSLPKLHVGLLSRNTNDPAIESLKIYLKNKIPQEKKSIKDPTRGSKMQAAFSQN